MARYLITSALPYINGIKHLGNLIGSMLPADVTARFLRQQGHEVLFICGTDEHGTPAELAALKANMAIEEYCKTLYQRQRDIYTQFNLSFNYFGRSSSVHNHTLTQDIFYHLQKNGCIQEKTIQQLYSLTDKRFLPDRYVGGECPHCHYKLARGDGCDGCGELLDPEDLINPFSHISGSRDIQLKLTQHIFLDLNSVAESLRHWIDSQTTWSDLVRSTALKWLNEGLKPRCISRDLSWGIPCPNMPDKVFYVWFDAPNAYISLTHDWAESSDLSSQTWQSWWLDPDVTYLQFMAKDNIPFHAIFWPGVLEASGMGWHKVDHLISFHWLLYNKGKFSTSQQRGVFLDDALTIFPVDSWRYGLMSLCPETADSNFSFDTFAELLNKDLADILGNLVQRVGQFAHKHYNGCVPQTLSPDKLDPLLAQRVQDILAELTIAYQKFTPRGITRSLRELWVCGNQFIAQTQPWKALNTDPQAAASAITQALNLLSIIAVTAFPVMPSIAQAIQNMLGISDDLASQKFSSLNLLTLKEGHVLGNFTPLFTKILPETVESLIKTFAGNDTALSPAEH